ncbi:MAG: hypothetical protein GY794_09835 [bacterium]|nr:hypothetical protein [bacterium]
MNTKKLILTVLATMLFSSPLLGAPLNTKVVAGDAAWVAHCNIEAILGSEVGKIFLAAVEKKKELGVAIDWMKTNLGCDPLKDIRGITAYGPRLGDQDGVVVADVTLAADKIIDHLTMNETYKSETNGKNVIHQWVDDDKGKKVFACFYDNKTIVASGNAKMLATALDVLDRKADSQAKTKSIKKLSVSKGAFFVLAANKVAFPKGKAPHAVALQGITSVSLQAGESKGTLFLNARVVAGSETDADNMRTFIQGMLALSMMIRQQEQFAELNNLGEKIKVNGKGKDVTIDATLPVKSAVRLLEFAKKQHEARMKQEEEEEEDDQDDDSQDTI